MTGIQGRIVHLLNRIGNQEYLSEVEQHSSHSSWICTPVADDETNMKLGIEVKGETASIDVSRLRIDPIPKLHAGDDHCTHPEHRLLRERANLCDEFVHLRIPVDVGR